MKAFEGCPGSRMFDFTDAQDAEAEEVMGRVQSQLRQWPIQRCILSLPLRHIIRTPMSY
jgi:hypothetical protein